MFKVLVLQALYGLSDDQAEFQIQDRLSIMRFLGLDLAERVPNAKRSGCSVSSSCRPVPWRICSGVSTVLSATRDIWRWAARSWTPPSSPHQSSATPTARRPHSSG
jgi:hypothetical protein